MLKQAIASLAAFIGTVNYSDSFTHAAAVAQSAHAAALPVGSIVQSYANASYATAARGTLWLRRARRPVAPPRAAPCGFAARSPLMVPPARALSCGAAGG